MLCHVQRPQRPPHHRSTFLFVTQARGFVRALPQGCMHRTEPSPWPKPNTSVASGTLSSVWKACICRDRRVSHMVRIKHNAGTVNNVAGSDSRYASAPTGNAAQGAGVETCCGPATASPVAASPQVLPVIAAMMPPMDSILCRAWTCNRLQP